MSENTLIGGRNPQAAAVRPTVRQRPEHPLDGVSVLSHAIAGDARDAAHAIKSSSIVQEVSQDRKETRSKGAIAKMIVPARAALIAELGSMFGISQQMHDPLSQLPLAIEVHVVARHAVHIDLRAGVVNRGDDWDSLPHRFDVDKAKPFPATGHG